MERWKKVSGVICERRLPARVKGKVYSLVIRPAMVYGLETVAVTKKQVEEMEIAVASCLRKTQLVDTLEVLASLHQYSGLLNRMTSASNCRAR